MNAFLWIVAALLAVVFLASGSVKVIQPKEKLVASGQAVLGDFNDGTLKAIGTAEILAAFGLTIPPLFDIAPALAPVAAVGLVLLMLGAATVHLRRREISGVAVSLITVALAAVVVWGRFGPESFTA